MVLDQVLPDLKRHLKYGLTLHCLPFRWDDKSGQIVQNLSRLSIHALILVHGLYTIFQVTSLFRSNIGSVPVLLEDKIVAGLIVVICTACFVVSLEFEPDFTPMRIINRVISGQDISPPGNQLFARIFKIFCLLMTTTYWMIPIAVVAMGIFRPCKPPLLGSFVLCPTSVLGPVPIYWIPVILGAEFFVSMQFAVRGTHHALYSLFLLVAMFWENVQLFLKQDKAKGTGQIQNMLLGYRKLQISEKILNSTFRTRVFLPIMFAIPLVQILSAFAFLTLFHTAGWLLNTLFCLTWLDGIFSSLVSLSSGSVIYTKTNNWILDRRGGQDGRKSYGRKVARSYRPLRLEFGSNFIDRLTPLVMQEFCVRNTASLLLLRGQGKTRMAL